MNKDDLKNFALIWAFITIGIGVYYFVFLDVMSIWPFILAVVFTGIAFFRPMALSLFYKTWIKIGNFIGSIISKIVMFILFFGVFTPVAIFLKVLGKDLLHKKLDKSKESYWIKREYQPQSMKNQF